MLQIAPMTAPSSCPSRERASAAWLAALRADGGEREAAVADLHALLLRAARFELRRRRAMLAGIAPAEAEDLAQQAADDALVAVLAKLDRYRGDSRFTTWAYKFALLEAAVKARRRAWHDREVVLDDERWATLGDRGAGPAAQAESGELLDAVRTAVAEVLTPHQRRVLLAIAVGDVPIDVLAERMDTTRGALYKTVHDARRKLRARLAEQGLSPEGSGHATG
jgi:RNA polymerase sigma-70 factor (ECF subfamily)